MVLWRCAATVGFHGSERPTRTKNETRTRWLWYSTRRAHDERYGLFGDLGMHRSRWDTDGRTHYSRFRTSAARSNTVSGRSVTVTGGGVSDRTVAGQDRHQPPAAQEEEEEEKQQEPSTSSTGVVIQKFVATTRSVWYSCGLEDEEDWPVAIPLCFLLLSKDSPMHHDTSNVVVIWEYYKNFKCDAGGRGVRWKMKISLYSSCDGAPKNAQK